VITSPKKYQGENLSDDELMEALVKREPSALEYIYRRYKLLLRAVIMSVSHDETDADDVLTDVFQQLWAKATAIFRMETACAACWLPSRGGARSTGCVGERLTHAPRKICEPILTILSLERSQANRIARRVATCSNSFNAYFENFRERKRK
jgi:hypothetical protein